MPRRAFVWPFWLSLLFFVHGVVLGCASDRTDAGPHDAETDTSTSDLGLDSADETIETSDAAPEVGDVVDVLDLGSPTPTVPTCGAPPYITLSAAVIARAADGTDTAMPGITITNSLCPTVPIVSDATGHFSVRITDGATFVEALDGPGILPTIYPEALAWGTIYDRYVWAADVRPLLVGFNAGASYVEITTTSAASGTACDVPSDIVYTIDGFPGAIVTYYDNTPAPHASTTSATTDRGMATASALPPDGFVSATGTRGGCAIERWPNFTGRVPLRVGFVSRLVFSSGAP